MKWVVAILFIPFWVFAQSDGITHNPFYSISNSVADNSSFLQTPFPQLEKLKARLFAKQKKCKTDQRFLAFVFSQTHQQLLRNYVDNSTYQDLVERGDYNCLTGTIVYAQLLEHFGYAYTIIETNYHIFLMVKTSNGEVLLETTDPLHGFICNEEEIQKRINIYKQRQPTANSGANQYYFHFALYRTVNLNELEGLLYYNEAIKAFNQNQVGLAVALLAKTNSTYYSDRVDEFAKVLILKVTQNDHLAVSQKASYVKQLQLIRKSRLETTASK